MWISKSTGSSGEFANGLAPGISRELARRLSAAIPVERVSHAKDDSELAVSRAKVEIEMLQADLDYRQALAQLKTLMGEQ